MTHEEICGLTLEGLQLYLSPDEKQQDEVLIMSQTEYGSWKADFDARQMAKAAAKEQRRRR